MQKTIKLNPNSTEIHCDLGKAYLRTGHVEQAENAFASCLKIDPEYAFAHCGLASVYLSQKDFEKAAEHALEAIDVIPHFPEAHFNLGLALVGLDKKSEAITAFESCENMRFNLNAVYRVLAQLHHKNNPEKSRSYRELLAKAKAQGDFFVADDQK